MKDRTINVEADELVYRAAFAVQRNGYIIKTAKGDEKDLGTRFNRTTIIKQMEGRGRILGEDYTLESYPTAEPASHSIQIIKSTIRRLQKLGKPVFWLSPSNKSNFRNSVAVTPGPRGVGYKAGRPPRPLNYQAVRDYMIEHWDAQEIDGYEADDALSMFQTETSIAAHIDKDISMVPGNHINWVTMEQYYCPYGIGTVELVVSADKKKKKLLGRGHKFFFVQLLTGDNTDNIPGVGGYGNVKAYNVLQDKSLTHEDCLAIVVNIYKEKHPETWKERLLEVADLLWMVEADRRTGRQVVLDLLTKVGDI